MYLLVHYYTSLIEKEPKRDVTVIGRDSHCKFVNVEFYNVLSLWGKRLKIVREIIPMTFFFGVS